MSSKVFKNSSYYMLASLLPVAVSFFMLPIYTRYLTPTDYGVLALVLSLQMFLLPLMTLKINDSILRFYYDYSHDREKLNTYISTIFIFITILSTSVLILLLYYLDSILEFVFPYTVGYNDIFLLGIISSYFNIFVLISVHLLRVQEKAKLFMKISIFLFIISLCVNILEVIVFERGIYGAIEASLISILVSFFTYMFFTKEFLTIRFDKALIWGPLKFSLPLIPHSVSGLIFMYSDRIILERYVTISAIGLYMFSDKIAMLFKMIVNEFNNAFSPYFNKKSKESKKNAIEETQKIALTFVYFTSMLISLVAIFSVEIVYILFSEKYFETWIMIPLLSSSYIFRSLYCFSSSGLFYEKKTGKVAIITIIAGLSNIGLNLWLIPIYGIMAAIYTTIFSFFLTYLMSELISYKIYYLQLSIKKNVLILIYMFGVIGISIYLNRSFFEFGYVEYLYKLILISIGVALGYKLKLINLNVLKIRQG
jgi:O-antigen/teichoic acid export membrane protein